MSRLVLDVGAFVAAERGDRNVLAMLEISRSDRLPIVTHAGIVGQVWRSSARQVRLGRILTAVDVRPLDLSLAQLAGSLLAATGLSDVLDAALVGIAHDRDRLLTSDPGDMRQLIDASGLRDVAAVAV